MKSMIFVFTLALPFLALAQGQQPLNYDQMVTVLEERKPATVADALSAIKAEYPEYFENYALVARSMSIQGSTPAAPRAVVFDKEAKLVMTFNGQVGERGYDRIELMTFDDEKKTYDFREIKFFGDSQSEGTFEISQPGGVNGRCLNCHGQSGLPIWDSYPFWPDYFGSFAKTQTTLAPYQQKEVEAYLEFVSGAKSHKRYQSLPELSFAQITEMNSKLSRAFAARVRENAKLKLEELPALTTALKNVLSNFDPHTAIVSTDGLALPTRQLTQDETSELLKLSEYHSTKLVRYARNYGTDKEELLDDLIAANSVAISKISIATGVPLENKLQLWTYTQSQPADLILLPQLRQALGEEISHLTEWSIIPGRRFIEFSHPDALPDDSGIENALADLL